jgi:hypothetical protein
MAFNGKLIAATALVLGTLTTGAYAYTPEQQQMCSGDAMRLCGEYIPDVDRITACMIQKQSQLSDGCRAVFHAPTPSAPTASATTYTPTAKPSKPLSITPNLKRG